ncbi:MAG: xanthine dehydrogenase family protein subunit M [Deltaproteobacteria bacterium]|nr:xanthine dehydrogenase family protein subunit M [Deltaproteobacteria bacterium]
MLFRALSPFSYWEAKSISEANEILFSNGKKAALLAGGCSLFPQMKNGLTKPEVIVNITTIEGLRFIEGNRDEGLRIGSLATLRDGEKSPALRQDYGSLFDAITQIASVQVKNMGTIVGNITEGTPASDVATILTALGAKVKIVGLGEDKIVPLDSFYVHVRKTILEPGEMITEILVPPLPDGTRTAFLNLAKTKEDPAKVNVGVLTRVVDGVCEEARIAVGAVAPVIIRAKKAEAILQGEKPEPSLIAKAAEAARDDKGVRPITDIRSTAAYRKEMVEVLTRRALHKTFQITTH